MSLVDHLRGDVSSSWREKWLDHEKGTGWFVKELGGGWAITQGPYKSRLVALIVFWCT